MNNEGRQGRRRRGGTDEEGRAKTAGGGGERGGERVRKEVDSKVVEIRRGGNEGDGEEAGGLSLSQMRSDLLCLSLARPAGARRAFLVGLTISRLAARCWYSKTLSGDERHYPHRGPGRPRGPYVERPSWHEIAGPTKATDRRTLPTGWRNTVLHGGSRAA